MMFSNKPRRMPRSLEANSFVRMGTTYIYVTRGQSRRSTLLLAYTESQEHACKDETVLFDKSHCAQSAATQAKM